LNCKTFQSKIQKIASSPMRIRCDNTQAGFNLIQISILLTVASLVMVAVLPSPQSAVKNNATSVVKMNAILTALRQYQAATGVLPCPADPTQPIGSNTYGVASSNTGTTNNCVTGTAPNAAYADSTNHIAIGMVPVASLGLSYDYALDGYGRDITYAVDTNATAFPSSFCTAPNIWPGAITVNDNGNIHNTVAALVSHGQDGYGAWLPLQGTSGTASRFNTGSTDTSQADNAQVAHGGGLTANGAGQFQSFIIKPATSTFDDNVVYKSTQWNLNAMPQSYISSAAYTTAYNTVCATCVPASGYSYCRPITIDYTKVAQINGTDPMNNFPMLFAGTYSWLAQTPTGNVNSNSGYDIAFTSDFAGTSLLNYEQESYNSSTGAVNYWIQIPSVSHTANTTVYISYGNASVGSGQSAGAIAAVWGSSFNGGLGYYVGSTYQGVWHMGSGVNNAGPNFAASPVDSTQIGPTYNRYSYHKGNGNMVSVTSPWGVGTGIYFNNPSYDANFMDLGWQNQNSEFENLGTFTVEAWVNKTAASTYGGGSSYNDWITSACNYNGSGSGNTSVNNNLCTWGLATTSSLYTTVDNCPTLFVNSTSKVISSVASTTCPALNTWYHVAATRNGTTCTIYVNGVQTGQNTSCPNPLKSNGNGIRVANDDNGDESEVKMDELRFSKTAYSADWINTEYNNQNSPSTFYTIGAQSSAR
jgi:hypothetical protein